jgi:Flp pilus assembly pilin Flp
LRLRQLSFRSASRSCIRQTTTPFSLSRAVFRSFHYGGNTVISLFDNRLGRLHYTYNEFSQGSLLMDCGGPMLQYFREIWSDEQGQDIAEYAVMLAVILVLVIGTVRLIGSNANNAFSQVASSLQ